MKNLKKLRKQHKLSQQRLADILLVSQQSVYKYENNITSPDIETLIRMADYFNTSVDYLVEHTDIPNKIEPIQEMMLNEEEMELIQNYRNLSISQKKAIDFVIQEFHN